MRYFFDRIESSSPLEYHAKKFPQTNYKFLLKKIVMRPKDYYKRTKPNACQTVNKYLQLLFNIWNLNFININVDFKPLRLSRPFTFSSIIKPLTYMSRKQYYITFLININGNIYKRTFMDYIRLGNSCRITSFS